MILQGYEAKAFKAWEDCDVDYSVLSFASVAKKSGVDRSKVRRAVRALARKGLVKFYQMSWTDDGIPHGAGYGLTKEGSDLLRSLDQPHPTDYTPTTTEPPPCQQSC